jgi:beta-glucosidase
VDYLADHFQACSEAIRSGVNLNGYFLWSFIDNFEWSFGYDRRFGIVYCDFADQRRIPKDSYYFYREVIAGHEGP